MGKRPLHTSGEFTVEKATPELLADLEVKKWPTWSTAGSDKYVKGKKSPLKVYDCNELSYIISGKMEVDTHDCFIQYCCDLRRLCLVFYCKVLICVA